MSPFELPPATPPVSFDPPTGGPASGGGGWSRGRKVGVALASLGIVTTGAVVVGQLAAADEAPAAAPPVTVEPEPVGTVPPPADGKVVIQIGDGDPIVIDLSDLGLGDLNLDELNLDDLSLDDLDLDDMNLDDMNLDELDTGDMGSLPELGDIEECIGGPLFNVDLDGGPGGHVVHGQFPMLPGGFPIFGDDGNITIAGPDGVQVLDFGDGDGSVTITQTDGELTVSSDGDVDVKELSDVFADLPPIGGPAVDVPAEGDADVAPLPPIDFDEVFDCLGVDFPTQP